MNCWDRPGCSPHERRDAPAGRARNRPRLALPADARRALPDDLQVPPVLLGVRDPGAAPAWPHSRQRACRVAAAALQPMEPRGLRPGPMIVYAIPIISQLETVMRHVLNWFHSNLGLTWAWSIVATTVVVRMLLVPLTIRQIHSTQSLQKHAPQLKELKQKYKNERQKQNEELLKFDRANKINAAAACLPIVAQLPVFFALYLVLRKFAKHPPTGDLSLLDFL